MADHVLAILRFLNGPTCVLFITGGLNNKFDLIHKHYLLNKKYMFSVAFSKFYKPCNMLFK